MTPSDSRHVAEVLADVDLMRITDGNPDPVGEYETEAKAILRHVREARKKDQVIDRDAMAGIIAGVFRHWFDQDISPDEAQEVASRLIGLNLEDVAG